MRKHIFGKRVLLSCSAIAGTLLALPTGSYAQGQAQISAIEEIVVTSRRREENLQEIPLAVAAFSATALEQKNVFRFEDLGAYVPNLVMEDSSRVNISSITIRGIGGGGPNTERSFGTGLYIDGMYIADSSGAYNSTFGIERIEVLRGPQGTLFGRNTTGGLINIVTQRPGPDPDSRLNVEYGRFNLVRMSMAGNMTFIPDKMYGRVGVSYESDHGFYEDTLTGDGYSDIENRTGKAAIRWVPTDNLTIDLSGTYSWEPRHAVGGDCHWVGLTANQTRSNSGLTAAGLPTVRQLCDANEAAGPRKFQANPMGIAHNETTLITAQPQWDSNGPIGFLDNLTISMNLGWRHNSNNYYSDGDFVNARITARASGPVGRTNTSKSAELLFNAAALDNRLDVTAGLYWYKDNRGFNGMDCAALYETVRGTGRSALCGNPGGSVYFDDLATFTGIFTGNQQVLGIPNVDNTNKSAFAHMTYNITDAFKVDVGGRYSVEDKSMRSIDMYLTRTAAGYEAVVNDNVVSNIVDAADTWKKFTPKASLTYQLDSMGALDSAIVYGSWATGFLSGGFNNEGGEQLLAAFPSFDPEEVTTYEVGAKTTWLDNRARVNVALFKTDYKSRQVAVTIDNTSGIFGTEEMPTVNLSIANSKIKGFEVETNWNPIENLLIDANLSYLWSKSFGQDSSSIPANILPFVQLDTSTSVSNDPRWRASWGVSYTVPMPGGSTITPRVNGNYVQANRLTPTSNFALFPADYDGPLLAQMTPAARTLFATAPQKGLCYVGSYVMWNGRVTWEDAGHNISVAVYGSNLSNVTRYRICASGYGAQNVTASGFGLQTTSIQPPITYGIQTSFRF